MDQNVQIKLQIKEINLKLKNFIRSFSIPQSAPSAYDLRSIDANLFSLFVQSSLFLNSLKQIKNENNDLINTITFQLKDCKTKSNKITDEIVRRTTDFTKEITRMKEKYNKEMKNINKEHNAIKSSENQRHMHEMETFQSEIDQLNSSYEKNLSDSISKCIEERDKFNNEYNVLNNQFKEIKIRLENDLLVSENTVKQISNELKQMEEQNAEQLKSLESSYQEKLSNTELNFKEVLSRITKDTSALKLQIQQFNSTHNNDLDQLREQLKELNTKNDNEVLQIVDAKKKENLEKERNLFNTFTEEESEYKKTILLKKSESLTLKNSLKQKLSSLKEQVAAQDAINDKKLKATNFKADQEISEKEAKLKKLIVDQKNVIEITKKRYLEDIKQEHKRNENDLSLFRQKILKQQIEFDSQKKKLEKEVLDNIKIRNKIQMELSNAKNGKPSNSFNFFDIISFSIADIIPHSKSSYDKKFTSISEMTQLFQHIDKMSQKKFNELKEFEMKKEVENQKFITQFEKVKNQLNSVHDEVQLLKHQKEELLKEKEEIERMNEIELTKNEKKLREKISNQREVIFQLHFEIQKISIDLSDKENFNELRNQHHLKLKQIQDQIDIFNNSKIEKIQEKNKKMNERFLNEKQKLVEEKNKILNEIYESLLILKEIKSNYKDESLKEFEKWSKMRKEINDTNVDLYSKSNKRQRPFSSISLGKNESVKPSLPRLKKQ